MSWRPGVIQEKVGRLGGAYNSQVGNQRFSAFISDKKTAPERENGNKARIK